MASAIPYIGSDLVQFLWGGFSVDNATLNRFFSLHYLLPFIIAALVVVHLLALHVDGSNNPLGISSSTDKLSFHPYFTIKDLLGFILFFIFFASFVFFAPNVLGHSDNYCEADPLVTPAHIVPEWYFLPFYAILRGIPNKLLGVIALLASILVLLLLPLISTSRLRASSLRPVSRLFFWLFIFNFFLLGWLGAMPADEPFVTVAQVATIYHFVYFLVATPLLGWLENYLLFTPTKTVASSHVAPRRTTGSPLAQVHKRSFHTRSVLRAEGQHGGVGSTEEVDPSKKSTRESNPRDYADNIHILVYTRADGELQHTQANFLKEQISRAIKHINIRDIPVSSSIITNIFYDICGADTLVSAREGWNRLLFEAREIHANYKSKETSYEIWLNFSEIYIIGNSKLVFQQAIRMLKDSSITTIEHPKANLFTAADYKALIRSSSPYTPKLVIRLRERPTGPSESGKASPSGNSNGKSHSDKPKDSE